MGGHFPRGMRAHILLQSSLAKIVFEELEKSSKFKDIIENNTMFFKKLEVENIDVTLKLYELQDDPALESLAELFEETLTQL